MNSSSKKLICLIFFLFSSIASAEDNIKLGLSAAFTGASAALGNEINTGIAAYFKYVNQQQGGVQGRKLELIIKDDGYDPQRAAKNVRALIDDGVVALIGNVGTPTAVVTVPIVNQKKTLLFGAFSGGSVLRPDPPSRYIINYRPSYSAEISKVISTILAAGIKAEEIAFFTQRDSYGDAGYIAAKQALAETGFNHFEQLAHGRYTRNTLNVENAVAAVLTAEVEPKAIIMAGSY